MEHDCQDDPRCPPGFRFSGLDAVVLLIASVASLAAAGLHFWMGLSVGFVVLHFFLFCNVFRLSRSLELVWAAIFVGLATAAAFQLIPWAAVFSGAAVTALVVIILETRRPSYHGIGWKRLNPNLFNGRCNRLREGEPAAPADTPPK